MHRSGTSLVSGMLSLMGVYLDPAFPRIAGDARVVPPGPLMRKNGYGEAHAFRLLNERLLLWAGSDWDSPAAFLEHRDRSLFERRCLLALQSATFAGLKRDFLGGVPRAQLVALAAWGWKDPRTSLTLPYWLQLFPNARILHVRRDPDKIADSLMRRVSLPDSSPHPASLVDRMRRALSDPAYTLRAVRRRIGLDPAQNRVAPPILDRAYCHKLTEQYVDECIRYRSLGDRYTEIHYEDVLLAPRTLATQIAEFAGIETTPRGIERAAAFVTQDNLLAPVIKIGGETGIRRGQKAGSQPLMI